MRRIRISYARMMRNVCEYAHNIHDEYAQYTPLTISVTNIREEYVYLVVFVLYCIAYFKKCIAICESRCVNSIPVYVKTRRLVGVHSGYMVLVSGPQNGQCNAEMLPAGKLCYADCLGGEY